ncbi:MAG: hypothetical protein AAF495_16270 [Pseudomonadota bacterium]
MPWQTIRRFSVHRFLLLFAVTLVLAFAWTSGQAAMTDYQRQQVTQYLHSPKVNMDAGIFDGTAFNPSVDANDAAAYMNDYIKTLNRAVQAWNKLTSGATGSAEGQALLKELNEKLAFAKAMRSAYPAFQAGQQSQSTTQGAGAASGSGVSGGMTDYQKQQMTQYLDSEAMRRDSSIFDGSNFVPGVPFTAFEQYYQTYMKTLDRAISTWERQIPNSSKATPDGQALQSQLKESVDWANAMSARYPAAKAQYQTQQQATQKAQQEAQASAAASKEAHKEQCVAFQQQAMTPLARDPMIRLINQMHNGNSGIGSVEGVERHRTVAAEVLAVCQSLDYELVISKPCFYVLGRWDHDPQNWCEAAGQADALIQAMALNQARQTIAIVGDSTIQSVPEFHEREGWLTFEGPVTFEGKMTFSREGREAVMDNVAQVLQAAGIEDAEAALWGEQKARLATLREEVEKTAGSWQSPQKKADNYSTALVANQIKEWHEDAEVLDAYLSRASWKIHKNALGIPDRRTLPGYVIFKLPEDPYCQLRSYTLTEQHAGGGTYQEAAGVRIGYVRFQDCP